MVRTIDAAMLNMQPDVRNWTATETSPAKGDLCVPHYTAAR
jgi:hypothetical protein